MAFRFGAWRPITVNLSPSFRDPIGAILHVQVGYNSPYGWFQNPASESSADFWIAKDGRVEQYADPDEASTWEQGSGNDWYIGVETEGYPEESLTDAQVASFAALYRAAVDRYGWPTVLAEAPGEPGLGWHGMGGTAWGNHPGCPGDRRRAQRPQILTLAQGDDMVTTQDKLDIAQAVWGIDPLGGKVSAFDRLVTAQVQATAALGAVKALAAAQGADPAAIEAAVKEGVAAALSDLRIVAAS